MKNSKIVCRVRDTPEVRRRLKEINKNVEIENIMIGVLLPFNLLPIMFISFSI